MVWERQPNESSKAFHAFSVYRDAGPTRSLRKVSQESSKSLPLIKRWSRRYGWVSRVRALEDHEENIRCEAREAAECEAASNRVMRENELREWVFENEERAVRLETEMLDRFERVLEELPIIERQVVQKEDGVPVKCVFKPAIPDTVLAIKRLHEIAARGVPEKLEFEEVRRYGLSDAEREELDSLANDPRLGELFHRLFDANPLQDETGDNASYE